MEAGPHLSPHVGASILAMAQVNNKVVPWNELVFLSDSYDTIRLVYFEEDQKYRELKDALVTLNRATPHVFPEQVSQLKHDLKFAIGEAQQLILDKLEKVRHISDLRRRMLTARQRSVDLKNDYENKKNEMLPKMDRCQGVPGKPRKVMRAGDVSLIRKFREWKGVTIDVNEYGQKLTIEIDAIDIAAAAHGVPMPNRNQNITRN